MLYGVELMELPKSISEEKETFQVAAEKSLYCLPNQTNDSGALKEQ